MSDLVASFYSHIPEFDESAPATLSPSEREKLLKTYYPDYSSEGKSTLSVGPNAGQIVPKEIAAILESRSRLDGHLSLPEHPDYDVDVLIVGGGGAGITAALFAAEQGVKVLLATKLRVGDSNTVMAEGGIQTAIGEGDSPVEHFRDTFRGGHGANDPALLAILVKEGPKVVEWLVSKGVLFDRDAQGNLSLRRGGGTSRPRLISAKDYTGLELVRVLKEDVVNAPIDIVEFSPAVELLQGPGGTCAGAVLLDLDSKKFKYVKARSVILTTGGSGRLHLGEFATSNHFGATGDGLCMAYRLGAQLVHMDSFQYHPTGVIFPSEMAGMLITEAVRGAGARMYNRLGKRFVNELETRDVVASAIIRECADGRGVPTGNGGFGIYLDLCSIDRESGEGTVSKRFPNIVKLMTRHHVDPTKYPILVYPTLHYQNGGIRTDENSHSTIPHLFVSGEASGGLHGKNRLMGNSLLELFVFGKRSGLVASREARDRQPFSWKETSLSHVDRFENSMNQAFKGAERPVGPTLFPDYRRREQ
ncbi:MAG: FAD-dependent oxidoreductase [Nitrospirota bacterium]|nr:FAD-dependent oxidoreductase [Nitrospirota bacterium]